MTRAVVVFAVVAASLQAAAQSVNDSSVVTTGTPVPTGEHSPLSISPEEWTYGQPNQWYAQRSSWSECGNSLQSPIPLATSAAESARPAFLKMYMPRVPPSSLLVQNTGHSIKIDMSHAGITLSSSAFWSQFTLSEMTFHSPSEHTIDGRRHPLEQHLIFEPSDNAQLRLSGKTRTMRVIIAVLFDLAGGSGNPFLADLISGGLSSALPEGFGLNLTGVTPYFDVEKDSFFSYPGSLTTPPCSEVVHWLVSADVKSANHQQLAVMSALVDGMQASGAAGSPAPFPQNNRPSRGNARPLQNLNHRTVKLRSYFSFGGPTN